MEFRADLHIHSPYSRATSRESTLAGLAAWARIKGINIIGSGDFTHPAWFDSISSMLEPAEPGLYRLRGIPDDTRPTSPVRFLLSAEISCIYKRHGRVRKVHNLVYVPDLEAARLLNTRLSSVGNIVSDGRPILGLDSRDLLEILLETAPEGFMVPAHVWTPWFSLFGSKSGFDSLEECFGDLSSHIFALETGLSSDPAMNRLISALDGMALISNSDCHSPSKLGREANLFSTGFDYFSLRDAIRSNDRALFAGTIEFFPEEGKYHADGHRACGICLDARETRKAGHICPSCSRPLTIGVQHRVLELADRTTPYFPESAPSVYSLVPLPEVLGELFSCGTATKRVAAAYDRIIKQFGSELDLLLAVSHEEIQRKSPLLAEAVMRMRDGRVMRTPGYDGEYGRIRLFGVDDPARTCFDPGILEGC